ncbi:hypothetical protein [Streptosporangium sp. NBC_01756]|nr:hypothetical protein [Streptosporangium sp. NBC_01756]WSC83376.1 hypothetical protein OIE48_23520 [Streptosporangium sp. NBC_01756]
MLHRFIVELAGAEEHPEPVTIRPRDVAKALFGPRPLAEALPADGTPMA